MNQFRKILSFELKNYFPNKIFVGITLFLVAAIAVVMFLPGIMDLVRGDETPESAGIPSGAEIETAEDDGRAGMPPPDPCRGSRVCLCAGFFHILHLSCGKPFHDRQQHRRGGLDPAKL